VDSAEADKVGSQRIRFCAYAGFVFHEGVRHRRIPWCALCPQSSYLFAGDLAFLVAGVKCDLLPAFSRRRRRLDSGSDTSGVVSFVLRPILGFELVAGINVGHLVVQRRGALVIAQPCL
jgi:hypothetical protein